MQIKFFIAVSLLVSPIFSFAYDDKTTHPALTDEIIDLFNLYYPNSKFSSEEKELIKKGSIEEDFAPRWMTHFYDPVYNRGLWGNPSANVWAQDSDTQVTLTGYYNQTGVYSALTLRPFEAPSDYSWERAIYDYVWGDKKRGMEALGHVLHLIEDSSVPDHTRNDAHPPILDFGSPYEFWTKRFTPETLDGLATEIYFTGTQIPTDYSGLYGYFNSLAMYSNNNFFSKDTIFDVGYHQPLVDFYGNEILKNGSVVRFGFSDSGRVHLIRVPLNTSWRASIGSDDVVEPILSDADDKILTDYWTRLSKQAVLHGAGVVKLFLEEAEKERKSKELWAKNRSLADKLASVFSFFGPSPEPVSNISELSSDAFNLESRPPSNLATGLLSEGEFANRSASQTSSNESVLNTPNFASLSAPANLISSANSNMNSGLPTNSETPNGGDGSVPAGFGGGMPIPNPISSTVESLAHSAISESDTTAPGAPVVQNPVDGANFTVASINFSGTAENDSIISNDFNNATTSVDLLGNWLINLNNLNQGTTTISFSAQDAAGNKSSSTQISIFVDSEIPDFNLTIQECEISLSAEDCVLLLPDIKISWSSSALDIDHFEIICKKNNVPCENFLIGTSTALYSLSENSSYIFTGRAFDKNGNKSIEINKSVTYSPRPVVINEIAWAGTKFHNSDEWIELANITTSEISLDGWTLFAKNSNKPYIPLSGKIPAKGYFLLERTDDETVSDIPADLIYGNNGSAWALNDSPADILVLSHASTTIDETIRCNTRWCGGSTSNERPSAERIAPMLPGSNMANWATALGTVRNGKDEKGDPIKGTPKARNSVNYLISLGDNLTENKILKSANSPYLVNNSYLIIPEGLEMSIEPGVVIKIAKNSTVLVRGKLKSEGAQNNEIVFTSIDDDSYAGDMNGNGTSTSPMPGDWRGLHFSNTSLGSNVSYTKFIYGGKWNGGEYGYQRSMVSADHVSLPISNSNFEKSFSAGLFLNYSDSVVENSSFLENKTGIIIYQGAPLVSGNIFESNNDGISQLTTQSVVKDNVFNNNTGYAVFSADKIGTFSGNTGEGNGKNVISIYGNIGVAGSTTTLEKNEIPYGLPVNSYGPFMLPAGAGLKIGPGSVFKADNKGQMVINGTLHIDGTESERIRFSSLAEGGPGEWKGLLVNPGGLVYGGYFSLKNGGGDPGCESTCAGFGIKNGSIELSNGVIENNLSRGMRIESSSTTLINFEFKNHASSTALQAINSKITLDHVSFTNNFLAVSSGSSIFNVYDLIFSGNITISTPPDLF